jgi:hypothetical protein
MNIIIIRKVLAVLLCLGELALDLLEHEGRRRLPRRRELELERAGGLDGALGGARRVLDLASHRHLHLEHPRGVLLVELGDPGVAQRDGRAAGPGRQPVHPGLAGGVLVALTGEPQAVELLAIEAVRGVERLGVGHAHGPVRVAHGERHREVVRERRRRGRRADEREARQGGVVHGDAHVADEAEGGDEDDDEGDGGEDGDAEDAPPEVTAAVAAAVVAALVERPHGRSSGCCWRTLAARRLAQRAGRR